MALAKRHGPAKREIFVSGEAKSTGILDMYSEHFQRRGARKDPFCGCRIPKLYTLRRARCFVKFFSRCRCSNSVCKTVFFTL